MGAGVSPEASPTLPAGAAAMASRVSRKDRATVSERESISSGINLSLAVGIAWAGSKPISVRGAVRLDGRRGPHLKSSPPRRCTGRKTSDCLGILARRGGEIGAKPAPDRPPARAMGGSCREASQGDCVTRGAAQRDRRAVCRVTPARAGIAHLPASSRSGVASDRHGSEPTDLGGSVDAVVTGEALWH